MALILQLVVLDWKDQDQWHLVIVQLQQSQHCHETSVSFQPIFRGLLHSILDHLSKGEGGNQLGLAMFIQCFMLYFTNLFYKTENEICSSVIEMDQMTRKTN